MISIRDTGAFPTSEISNFDCTAAIQAAINKAQFLGESTIKIPKGEWLVLGTLKNYNNLTFVGESTPKHYWRGVNGDYFSAGGSVLKGDYTKDLFDKPAKEYWVTLKDLSFTGFSRLVASSDCRSFEVERCSFKNMIILNAPASSSEMCQNFNFRQCAFTIYNLDNDSINRTPFIGRLVDCLWSDNIFLGNKGFDINQARANRFFKNRFEWIDRDAAITMFACDNNMFQGNWFDRVAGSGIQLKQKNKDIAIVNNTFSRCGGLVKSDNNPVAYSEACRSSINLWGDQEGKLQIHNNMFILGPISDKAGAALTPKYVIGLEPIGGKREFSFKGNSYAGGYTDSLIYGGGVDWMQSVTTIETEAAFDHLSDDIVDLSKYSSGILIAQNSKEVTVKEIPENLTVYNTFNGSITITQGPQTGLVFGGKVNGIRRFGKFEQLYENVGAAETANGLAIGNKITYTVPIATPLKGAPIYIAANYRTYGVPTREVEVTDATGTTVLGTMTPLELSDPGGEQILYAGKFIIPADYTGLSLRFNFYASKDVVLTSNDSIAIDAFCATYGDWITRGTLM